MVDKVQHCQQAIIQLRKKLANLETRRTQYEQNVPSDIWQELVEVSHALEQAEKKLRDIFQEIIGDVNHIRANIVSMLAQYNQWRKQIRQVEEQFLANIVRPGYQLKLAVRQREALELEYKRILAAIQQEGYANQEELEADIRQVLSDDDIVDRARDEVLDEELKPEDDYLDTLIHTTVDDVIEVISKEEIIREFKRVVMPKIHPDTSDTPAEVFITVYEVLKKEDPLLMEAYIVQYRGEIQPESDTDPLVYSEQVLTLRQRYQRVWVHLQRRIERLIRELTAQELDDPEIIQEKMRHQRQEILARITNEAEQILYWREKIEGLAKDYFLSHDDKSRAE